MGRSRPKWLKNGQKGSFLDTFFWSLFGKTVVLWLLKLEKRGSKKGQKMVKNGRFLDPFTGEKSLKMANFCHFSSLFLIKKSQKCHFWQNPFSKTWFFWKTQNPLLSSRKDQTFLSKKGHFWPIFGPFLPLWVPFFEPFLHPKMTLFWTFFWTTFWAFFVKTMVLWLLKMRQWVSKSDKKC